ncbi:hypothetical protein [Streptomyces sp. NPDC000351]|uniref:hypothetical protein n=1 Tax=Streptomyces sp. NPDC000351 TaxID=3154250 RepID=UPI0033338BB3
MPGAKTAVAWLASVAPDPETCLREWERDPLGLALLPAGRAWDVLILPGRLGRTTLDVLCRVLDHPGPVLAGFGDARTGFLVPAGTAARWLGTCVRTVGLGTWIVVPYPGVPSYPSARAVRWLIPPDGTGTLTDPSLLELAMHEAAAALAVGENGGWAELRKRRGAFEVGTVCGQASWRNGWFGDSGVGHSSE